MRRVTCKDCGCFRLATTSTDDDDVGICLCHGYCLHGSDAVCIDFEG